MNAMQPTMMPALDLNPIKKFTMFAAVITVLQFMLREIPYETLCISTALIFGAVTGLFFGMAFLTPRVPAQRRSAVAKRQSQIRKGAVVRKAVPVYNGGQRAKSTRRAVSSR